MDKNKGEAGMQDINKPIISVIVPVYNTEKFLPRCLESITNQTYSRLQIIVVNDCSSGDAKSIIKEFMSKDSRIQYIEHEVNKGLFHARITGSEIATGDYIAFVDSDDYISIDNYRLLIDKAITKKADIVEGRIIREHENGEKFIQNYNNILTDELNGEEIQREFFAQEGLFYHWHVIWNKIYSKQLWDKCFPYYKKQTKNLVMTEDLVFSSVLFCNAKKYCSIKYEGYFYFIRAEAATGSDYNIDKFINIFNDMGVAFDFVESYLKVSRLHQKYGANLIAWKRRYFRLWVSRLKSSKMNSSTRNMATEKLKISLKMDRIETALPEDYYHSLINTPWDDRYEALKKLIASDSIKFISFDIFDTLVVRPFFDPRDLLFLVDEYFGEIFPSAKLVNFSALRIQAEERVRQLTTIQNPLWQDVNLDEIYEYIKSECHFPSDVVDKLKVKEIELEIQFSKRRESVYELYKMARILNKKIIFMSDMYLSKETIEIIIKKSGYDHYERLYVSSEERLLKHTGSLFQHVIQDLNIEADKILHIGDNWESDKLMAEKSGWNSVFINKTLDLLLNTTDRVTGASTLYFSELRPNKWEKQCSKYFSTRCMLANIANKIFDNPFVSFNAETDFNSDPYFVGYYALGMHTFGLNKWMVEDSIEKKINTIHFIARDGYLPYEVYNVLLECYPKAPKASYIYASRRSLLPFVLFTKNIYSLASFMSIHAQSRKSVMELFSNVLKENIFHKFEEQKILLDKKFESLSEFQEFINVLSREGVDYNKAKSYEERLKKYFNSKIKLNDATFDLGYSARLQTIIVNLIERRCDTYFVHTDKELPWVYSRRNGFNLESYYEFPPSISGILREHFFAELGPSCVGYAENGSCIEPVFEQYYSNHINELMIKTMQKASIDFSIDMVTTFKGYIPQMKMNKEVSLPLEMYIHCSKPGDRPLFLHSYSDDTVHGGNDKNSIFDWWTTELNKISENNINNTNNMVMNKNNSFLQGHNRISKIIFYSLFDRNTLKNKVKKRFNERSLTYKILAITYRSLRKIRRGFKN